MHNEQLWMCELVPAYERVRMEQYCLEAASEPMEGSISVHTYTCCGLLLTAQSQCSSPALQIFKKSVSVF